MRWIRLGVIACALGATAPARAEPAPRLEASGFVGLDYFGDNIQLGNSWAPEQVPGTSPLLGARVSYVALPSLWTHDDLHLDVAAEAELALATAFTGGNFDGGRMSYFAPVFGWRVHAMLRLGGVPSVRPHLVVGVGGETVSSSSPYMAKETDPVAYWGPGVSIPVSTSWQLRIDLRHGIMPAREGSVTSTVELQVGLATTFGLPRKAAPVTVIVRDEPVAPTVVDERDSDGDGLPDRLDTCPNEPETVNGIEDDDGCPEPDPDGDGLVGINDRCPDQAEDFDKFEDDDGCPDPDNDHDGVLDARDACPNEPETKNGIDDDDGCPDTMPADVTTALAAASAVKFDAGRAKLTVAAKKALELTVAALRDHASLRITIVGHTDKKAADDLARRRADAIKWYLVDQGIAADQIAITVGTPATARGPTIDIVLSPLGK